MGYSWHIGNGKKVRFWEDYWLGSSSLAIQYWKLYRIVNESVPLEEVLMTLFFLCGKKSAS
jgi:hypothetical protein